jgi:YD repeat-containing protein
VAWSSDSSSLAVVDQDLTLYKLDSGKLNRLSGVRPRVVAWGEPGIATATSVDETSSVQLFSPDGDVTAEINVDGVVTAMVWTQDDKLLALLKRQKYFKFGVNQQTFLLSWAGEGEPEYAKLADATLKPSTPRIVGDQFPYGAFLQFSPFGDEILYTRLHDPPAFGVSERAAVYHLQTGKERLLGFYPIGAGTARLSADGETALVSDEAQKIKVKKLWGDDEQTLFNFPVRRFDHSGDLIYAMGTLYQGTEVLWQLKQSMLGVFSPDGKQLALSGNGQVYVVDVPNSVKEVKVTPERLSLRRLRVLGLISSEEYLEYAKEQ